MKELEDQYIRNDVERYSLHAATKFAGQKGQIDWTCFTLNTEYTATPPTY